MHGQVNFPELDSECSQFLSIGVPSSKIPLSEKKKMENALNQLLKLQNSYEMKLKQLDQTPMFSKTRAKKYKRLILALQNLIRYYTATSFNFKQRVFAKYWSISKQLCSVLQICLENNITCNCDVELFQKTVKEEYMNNMPIHNYKWKLQALHAKLDFIRRKDDSLYITPWASLLPKLASHLKKYTDNVNVELSYAPPSRADKLVFSVLNSSRTEIDTKPAEELLKKGDVSGLKELISMFITMLGLSDKKEKCVLRCSVIRFVFDKIYPDICEEFISVDGNKFITQCLLISSFSPSAIQLCENPFTEEQFKTAIQALQSVAALRDINSIINWTIFYTNPLDIIADLAISVRQLGNFANENAKFRKLGRFASMADDVKPKKGEMMSFDDCFSLFFAAFVMNPPYISQAISKFISTYELSNSQQMNYARQLFSASIDYIMSFSASDVDQFDDSSDPLGILSV